MAFTVEVDQSRKIEQSGPTVLAFSNNISHAILIPSRVKEAALVALRAKRKSKEFAPLLLFSICLYLLLKDHLHLFAKIKIDVEYDKRSKDIKAELLRLIWKKYPKYDSEKIIFERVGRKSPADYKAGLVRKGRDKMYRKVSLKEVLRLVVL